MKTDLEKERYTAFFADKLLQYLFYGQKQTHPEQVSFSFLMDRARCATNIYCDLIDNEHRHFIYAMIQAFQMLFHGLPEDQDE